MEFSGEQTIDFTEAVKIMFQKLGQWKVMALASSVNDHVMVRNVSCLFYDDKIYFKTDKNFRKTNQLFLNPNVALCWSGIQVEGTVKNLGLVADEPGHRFEKGFEKYLKNSYNSYSHRETEILIEVSPKLVEVWDTSNEGKARQLFLDFDKKRVEVKPYDI